MKVRRVRQFWRTDPAASSTDDLRDAGRCSVQSGGSCRCTGEEGQFTRGAGPGGRTVAWFTARTACQ